MVAMATIAQKRVWLAAAETAYHELLTGAQTVRYRKGERETTNSQADAGKLASYIATLKAEISAEEGGQPARAPLYAQW